MSENSNALFVTAIVFLIYTWMTWNKFNGKHLQEIYSLDLDEETVWPNVRGRDVKQLHQIVDQTFELGQRVNISDLMPFLS
jgi:hypothetical protein